jgi:LysM repeat protein
MRKALENSCAKGCLVYALALVIVVVLGAAGLGGLSARLGAGAQGEKTQIGALTTSEGQATTASLPAADGNIASESNGTTGQGDPQAPQGAAPAPAAQAGQPAPQQPAPQNVPQASSAGAPQPQPPVEASGQIQGQAQNGEISGQASAPFYIVQEGDTLWGIAGKFSTTVEALQATNSIGAEFIQPGQLLYLPPVGQPESQPGAPPPAVPGDSGPLPTMPQTGVNSRP